MEYKPSILYYYGRIYPNTSENRVTVTESGTGLFVHNRGYSSYNGLFACDIGDSNGNIIKLIVGAYQYPSKYHKFKRIFDL